MASNTCNDLTVTMISMSIEKLAGDYAKDRSYDELNSCFGTDTTRIEDQGVLSDASVSVAEAVANYVVGYPFWREGYFEYEDRLKFAILRYQKIFNAKHIVIRASCENQEVQKEISRLDQNLFAIRKRVFGSYQSSGPYNLWCALRVRWDTRQIECDIQDVIRLFPSK